MYDILFVSDSISRSIERAKLLARAFKIKAIASGGLTQSVADDASIIVFDQILSARETVFQIREYLDADRKVAVYYSPGDHHEQKQAEALTGAVLLSRAENARHTLSTLYELFADMQGKRAMATPAGPEMNRVRRAFNDINLAAMLGAPPPITKVTWAAGAINAAIKRHGLDGVLETINAYHSHTTRHSLLVAAVCADFGYRLSLDDRALDVITSGGIVHDIGKTAIPLQILDKPGKLTAEEMDVVRRHPEAGVAMLKKAENFDERLLAITRDHHEMLDGSGYPNGKMAQDIPEEIRVMTICDIFAALVEDRAYKAAMPVETAHGILQGMGSKLDQKLFKEFKSKPGRETGGFAKVKSQAAQ
ncbi:putative nucleotidyltransferase with HDIG domain [Roseibium hamelinense]|uniref:Putative nucleotidyltransferase with HDIG domain n=1 Tax=Roseibium hamelinense TaxID=150831 RepID=A0A562T7M8_9HYPH|nr:HD domain-containing phosphohydrolase [Roseibium hamelinense]MTI43016.1 HD domain-containing protein [Roseibium hamelinense]TWI89627.1 putative nucleotidyltransferase with HDIG domain [Roseibium hamelinense]